MIYLDNAATSFPKAPGVAEAVSRQILYVGGNPGRASHSMARDAARLVFETREATAALVGLSDSCRLVFTQNATEALNGALLGSIRPGNTIATSSLEHNAVMRPLRHLEATIGIKLAIFDCDEYGDPDPESLGDALAAKPDLAVFTMASNVTGACLPWRELGGAFAAAGIPFGLDGSQAIGHLDFNFEESGASFLCFPGHKGLLGPTGTGALCLAEGFLPEPLVRGGTGSLSASERQPDFLPDRYESGTRNLAGIAGLGAAVDFVRATGFAAIRVREEYLMRKLKEGIGSLAGTRVYASIPIRESSPVLSFTVKAWPVSEIALELDACGIASRMGLHCAPAAHRSIGSYESGGTVRLSPGYFTTDEEIDTLVSVLERILT